MDIYKCNENYLFLKKKVFVFISLCVFMLFNWSVKQIRFNIKVKKDEVKGLKAKKVMIKHIDFFFL